jgi:hypothetical protein
MLNKNMKIYLKFERFLGNHNYKLIEEAKYLTKLNVDHVWDNHSGVSSVGEAGNFYYNRQKKFNNWGSIPLQVIVILRMCILSCEWEKIMIRQTHPCGATRNYFTKIQGKVNPPFFFNCDFYY